MGGTETSKPTAAAGSGGDKPAEVGVDAKQAAAPAAPSPAADEPAGREYVAPHSVPVAAQPQKDDAPKIVLNLPEAAGPAGEREVEVARARRRSATVKIARGALGSMGRGGPRDDPTAIGKHYDVPEETFVDLPSSPPPAPVSSRAPATGRPPPPGGASRVPLAIVGVVGLGLAGVWLITQSAGVGGGSEPAASAPIAASARSAGTANAAGASAVVPPAPPPVVAEPEPAAPALTLTAPSPSTPDVKPNEQVGAAVKLGPGVSGISGGGSPPPAAAGRADPWVPPPAPPRTTKPPTGKPPGDIPTSI